MMDNEDGDTNADNIRKQPKYKQLSLEQKLDIIDRVIRGGKQAQIASQFGVSTTTVSRVFLNREKYKLSSPQKKFLKNRTRIDTGKYQTLEALLYEWIKQKRSLGICISGPIIKEKALYFNEQLKGPASFKASEGWLEKFKKRLGIRRVSVQGERLSADDNGADKVKVEFTEVIEEGQYSFDNIYNADETGLVVKSLPEIGNNDAESNEETFSSDERARNDNDVSSGDQDDSLPQETVMENKINLRDIYKGFMKFKDWYETRAECAKEDACHLNRMQSVVEEFLLKEMLEED